MPHPRALFTLMPVEGNQRAQEVVEHPHNQHLVSIASSGAKGIDVGFINPSKSPTVLASLGRAENHDILLPFPTLSRDQCAFEIDPETHVVMLRDLSGRTQVYGQNATHFANNLPRKVLVQPGLNDIVGMGGTTRDLVLFELIWHRDPLPTMQKVQEMHADVQANLLFPEAAAPTIDDTATVEPSAMDTNIHTQSHRSQQTRFHNLGLNLGSGSFGTVYKAVNVDTGKFLAVKVMKRSQNSDRSRSLKREIAILANLHHPNIVEFLDCHETEDGNQCSTEIVMELKDGNLESLTRTIQPGNHLAVQILHQMLQALDFLASKGVIHRDLKPSNILFVRLPEDRYRFQLADFGLSKIADSGMTKVGTEVFMAPEIFSWTGQQTPKADVWSLFVTILWTMDIGRFRRACNNRAPNLLLKAILDRADLSQVRIIEQMALADSEEGSSAGESLGGTGATRPQLGKLGQMARVNVEERPSAGQLLEDLFKGKGRTTK